MKRVAVIGSGPVGALIAHELLNTGRFKVNLFDQAQTLSEISNPSDLQSNRLQLSGNALGRDTGNLRRLVASEIGGFSKVWGGTWDQLTEPDDKNWETAYESVDKLVSLTFDSRSDLKREEHSCQCQLQRELNNFTYSSKKFTIAFSVSKLLLSRIERKENTEYFDSWCSTQLLDLISNHPNLVFSKERKLISFQSEKNSVTLNFEGYRENFDILVLAAGPIGTAEIICRSNPKISLRLQDTALAYSVALRLPKRSKGKSLGFSHISSKLTDENNSVLLYSQFYTHMYENKLLITKRIPRFFKQMTSTVLYLLNPFLIVILHYASADISAHLNITYSYKQDCVITQDGKFLNYYKFFRLTRYLVKPLRTKGIFLIRLLFLRVRAGHSFHSGAAINPPWDESGKLKSHTNVFVAGALALSRIDPGPITKTSMAQAFLLTKEIIKQTKV